MRNNIKRFLKLFNFFPNFRSISIIIKDTNSSKCPQNMIMIMTSSIRPSRFSLIIRMNLTMTITISQRKLKLIKQITRFSFLSLNFSKKFALPIVIHYQKLSKSLLSLTIIMISLRKLSKYFSNTKMNSKKAIQISWRLLILKSTIMIHLKKLLSFILNLKIIQLFYKIIFPYTFNTILTIWSMPILIATL